MPLSHRARLRQEAPRQYVRSPHGACRMDVICKACPRCSRKRFRILSSYRLMRRKKVCVPWRALSFHFISFHLAVPFPAIARRSHEPTTCVRSIGSRPPPALTATYLALTCCRFLSAAGSSPNEGLFLVGYNWQNSCCNIPAYRVRAWRAAGGDFNRDTRISTPCNALGGLLDRSFSQYPASKRTASK